MSCVALLNKMLFVDLGVAKMFCSSTMLEFDCDDGMFLVFFHLTSLSYFYSKVKSINLLVCFSVRAKMVLANQIAGFQIK